MRISELDSVRGLASLVVLFHHCWQVLLPDQNTFAYGSMDLGSHDQGLRWAYWVNSSPLRLLFSGHAAVGVFFVLSGFVLTKFVEHPGYSNYASYVIRRVFRIWAPFAIVILVAALLCVAIGNTPIQDHPWVNLSWSEPVDFKLILGHLLMLGVPPYDSLDNPMWSLVHELRISLFFPLLLATTRKFPVSTTITAILLFLMLSAAHVYGIFFGGIHDAFAAKVVYSVVQTVRYTLFFIFGILLAIKTDKIKAVLSGNRITNGVLAVCAWVALGLPYTKAYIELFYATGAFVLLAFCLISMPAQQLLRHPMLVWLGKISYSLYLVHLVVILSLIHSFYGKLPMIAIVLLAIPCSLIAAFLTNKWVEQTLNEIGKQLAARLTS